MRIHREGYGTIAFLTVLLGSFTFLIWHFIPVNWVNTILSIVLFASWLFYLRFFRIPRREATIDENAIIAPADGLVVSVGKKEEDLFFEKECKHIAIFMSGWDVHINWAPMNGTVSYQRYFPGNHLLAKNPKSSIKNERSAIVVEQSPDKIVLIKQIAGIMARRVVTKTKPGVEIRQGDEIGFIKLGSRVELYLPENVKLLVQPGQKVQGSVTKLAKWS